MTTEQKTLNEDLTPDVPGMTMLPNDDDNNEVKPFASLQDPSDQPEANQKEEEAAESAYWKKKAVERDSQLSQFLPYQNVLEALKTNPDLVDVLQQAMSDQAAGKGNDNDGGDEYGSFFEDGENNANTNTPAPTPVQQQNGGGSSQPNLDEQATTELNDFMTRMAEEGIPDRALDQFQEFVRNPSGASVEDVWAAFENRQSRLQSKKRDDVEAADVAEIPSPVGALPGGQERPGTELKRPDTSGSNYVHNPNDVF